MTSTTIARVRLATDTEDRLAAQMRCQAALRPLDLEPPGQPARAILCIRSMRDPLPGALDLRSPHAPRATRWEHAARNAIRGALAGAVRVADGFVPLDAGAVRFEDRAEMLACAARDAAAGENRWWWQSLVPGLTAETVRRQWLREPELIAAALDVLDARFDAVPFLQALDARETIELLVSALRAHALETFAEDVIRALTAPLPDVPERLGKRPVAPPWVEPARPSRDAPSLTLEQRLFAGIALALRRAPARVRQPRFARETVVWIVRTRAREAALAAEAQGTTRPPDAAPSPAAPALRDERVAEPVAAAVRPRSVADTAPHSETPSSEKPARAAPVEDAASGQSAPAALPDSQPGETSARAPLETHTPAPLPIAIAGTTLSSAYAGVFFLLNAFIALGFYDPYRHRGLRLGIWRFLSLAAHSLLEDVDEDDDLWPLLGALEDEAMEKESAFRRPVSGRSKREVRAVAHAASRLRAFLASVFDPPHPARLLLHRQGRVTVTPAHVDVYFPLAAHPIEIRMSGLDRDPGWIPAAGRHVAFHFD